MSKSTYLTGNYMVKVSTIYSFYIARAKAKAHYRYAELKFSEFFYYQIRRIPRVYLRITGFGVSEQES